MWHVDLSMYPPMILPDHLVDEEMIDVSRTVDQARSYIINNVYYDGNEFYRQYMEYMSDSQR